MGASVSLASSLALLPVYASQLSPHEFGVVATGQVVALAASTVIRFGIGIGMFRFLTVYHERGDAPAAKAVVTTCLIATVVCALIGTTAMAAGVAIAGWRLAHDIRLVGTLIAANITLSAPRDIAEFALRAKQRPGAFVLLSSSFVVSSTILTGGLVSLHGGAPAVFAATLISNLVTLPIAFYALLPHLSARALSSTELKLALRFGIPSVPALLADWVTQYSDRLFLTRFSNLTQVGIYSMGYRLGLIEQQVLGAASQAAWDPFVLSNYRKPDGSGMIGRSATFFAIPGMALVVLISASAPTVLTIAHARHEYLAATPIVFAIALANFFGMLQYLFLAPTSIRLRPEVGMIIRGIVAGVNILLNLVWIPTFGILGAASATLVTFLVGALITEAVGRRLWRVNYEYQKLLLIVVGGLIPQAILQLADWYGISRPIGADPVFAMGIFCTWLLMTKLVSKAHLWVIARTIVGPLRRHGRFPA